MVAFARVALAGPGAGCDEVAFARVALAGPRVMETACGGGDGEGGGGDGLGDGDGDGDGGGDGDGLGGGNGNGDGEGEGEGEGGGEGKGEGGGNGEGSAKDLRGCRGLAVCCSCALGGWEGMDCVSGFTSVSNAPWLLPRHSSRPPMTKKVTKATASGCRIASACDDDAGDANTLHEAVALSLPKDVQ